MRARKYWRQIADAPGIDIRLTMDEARFVRDVLYRAELTKFPAAMDAAITIGTALRSDGLWIESDAAVTA